jgi:heme/copper-type cytochrome/quinol oxidase subunit 3
VSTAATAAAGRPVIDVSGLPGEARDSRSPSWWGNVLFMLIETTTVSLLVASYIYLWRNYPRSGWPPTAAEHDPPILRPFPELLWSSINMALLLLTVPLMVWVDRLCRRQFDELEKLNVSEPSQVPAARPKPPKRPAAVLGGLAILFVLGCASLALRWHEFPGLIVHWKENAYAGIVWTMLALHFLYVAVEALEIAVILLWIGIYGLGENQATDVILTAAYWYWTVGVGAVVYFFVYWFPRLV